MNQSAITAKKRLGMLLPAALLAGAVGVQPAAAQDAQKCFENIGKEIRALGKTAAAGQDKCHGTANKIGVAGGICNDVSSAPYTIIDGGKYVSGQMKSIVKLHDPVKGKCPAVAAATVLDKLPGGNVSNKHESLDELVTDRAQVTLGEADLDLDAAKIKCFKTISSTRRAVADKMVNTANACQKAQPPGSPLAAACLNDASLAGLINGKHNAINTACAGLTGAQVGNCEPLPSCVTSAAVAEGKNLAQIAYPSEQCTKAAAVADARTATVSIDTPTQLGGITVKVKYPRFDAGIDENGTDIDFGKLQNYSVSFLDAFDLDDALRVSALDPVTPFGSGNLVDIKFDVCRSFLPEASCSVATGQTCNASIDCRPPTCPTCLTATQCTISLAACVTDGDCGVAGGTCGEKCVARNRSCSLSQYIDCTSNADCPASEVCVSQRNLTTCEVEGASDENGNPVDGVACSVTISEP